MGIGFNTEESENDKVTKQDTIENYKHTIKMFGIPVWTSVKNHTIDSKVTED